ncbi:MAG TPA: ankyrin repeat domain-containing protein [Ktedonobacterales bacterium]|nr:ankyrin repeat domain-containing protein [Ktedonobacterales bacterium]
MASEWSEGMSSEATSGQAGANVGALINAAQQGDLEAARALLEADPALAGARDPDGQSPMMAAIYGSHPEIVALLRERGATTTIFEAAALGDIPALSAALAQDPAAVRAYSADGWTALHLAAHFGQIEAARALLAAGANVTAHSWNGLDNEPIHAAAANKGNAAMVAALLDAGAQVNARQHGGFTPLHQAAQNGDAELATLLLSRGARRSLVTDKDLTACDLAEEAGHQELADKLS